MHEMTIFNLHDILSVHCRLKIVENKWIIRYIGLSN